tara:strand:+ start:791 stop:1198 length:408 start_codon:yes stop_codon:yes gene_type:complete
MKLFNRWKTREEEQKEELSKELNDCNLISFLTESEKEVLKSMQHNLKQEKPRQFVVKRANKADLVKANVERRLVSMLRNKLNRKDRDQERFQGHNMITFSLPADLKANFKELAGDRNMGKVLTELIRAYVKGGNQ